MNTAELASFIKEPEHLGRTHLEDLAAFCKQNPYSGVLHLLYLKALKNSKSIEFENALNLYAIRIPDRVVLHQLLENEANSEAFVQEEVKSEIVELNSQVEDSVETLIETPMLQEEDKPDDAQVSEDQSLAVEEITFEQEYILSSEVLVDDSDDEKTQELEQAVESNNLDKWIDNTITFEGFDSLSEEEEVKVEEDTEIEAAEHESLKADVSFDIETKTDIESESDTEIEPQTIAIDEVKSEIGAGFTFYDWLEKERAQHVPAKPIVEEKTTTIEESHEELKEEAKPEDSFEDKKTDPSALVDKFIAEEPKISRPKSEFFSPVKSAKESINEDGIPVSETLAKIYELQGNIPKAIQIYEKLAQLHAEKSPYFQSKIEALKKS